MRGEAPAGMELGVIDGASARLLQAIVDVSPDAIVVVDRDRRLSWLNASCSTMLGWSDEVIGQDVGTFLHEEDRVHLENIWPALTDGQEVPGHYQIRLLTTGGQAVPHVITIANRLHDPDVEGVIFTARDPSPDLEAEAELTSVVGSLQEGLIVVDHAGAVVHASPAAMALWGLQPGDALTGRSLRGLLSGRVTDEAGRLVPDQDLLFEQALRGGKEVTGIVRGWDHQDGRRQWLSITTRLLHDREPPGVAISIVDVTDRYVAEQALRSQVRQDQLTGLPNRTVLAERLQELLDRRSSGIAVLFLDLDGFKAVNDTHGHHCGDTVLREAARRLQAAVRPSDLVARFGGDEFVVVSSDCGTADDALAMADRIRVKLAGPCRLDGGEVDVRASVGIAWVDSKRNGIDGSAVLQAADMALYRVKQEQPGGRDLVVIRF